jgi:hypothetical protein
VYITHKFLSHFFIQVTNYTAFNLQHQSGLSGFMYLSWSLMDLVTTKFSITSKSCSEDSQHVNIPNKIPKVVCIYAPQKIPRKSQTTCTTYSPQDASHGIDKLFRTKEQLLLLSSQLHNVISQDRSNGVVDGCKCPL